MLHLYLQLFDRRSKVARTAKFTRIKKYWDEVTAEMMTEEETGDEDDYIRHRPAWRSPDFIRSFRCGSGRSADIG